MAIQRVGLVGCGTMGTKFLDRLRGDFPVTAFDLDEEKLAAAAERGADPADSPAEVGRAADVTLLSLPSNEAVEAAATATDGVLAGVDEGDIVVDTGTTRVALSRRLAAACADAGAAFLEAPLTRAMGIAMMVGGDADTYERAEPVLDCVASDHRRIGGIGQGQTLKLMKQIVGAGYDAACAEAVEFGRATGVDPELLNDFLEMGVSERLFAEDQVIEDEGGVGAMGLRYKDLTNALDLAAEAEAAVPVTNAAAEAHKRGVRATDDRPRYHEGIVRYWRDLNE